MDISAFTAAAEARQATLDDLYRQWDEKVAVVSGAQAVGAGPDWSNLFGIITKILPVIVPLIPVLLAGGFTWPMLLALIPEILKQLFPDMPADLLALLAQIIKALIGQ